MRGRFIVTLALAGCGVAGGAAAQGYALQRGLVSGGVGVTAGAQYSLVGTIGQPVIGLATGPTLQLCAGFWCSAGLAPTAVPGQPAPAADPRALLLNSYPNPFNPATTIAFSVPAAGPVELVVHDVAGRVVRRLWGGAMPVGRQAVSWDGTDDAGRPVGSGVFLAHLTIGSVSESRRMTIVK